MSLFLVGSVQADTIAGRGWLRARGQGLAEMKGQVHTLTISGNGTLWYLDEGEPDEPVVTGKGERIEHPNGWVQYVGFDGTFQLQGADNVTVKLVGTQIELFVVGKGVVHLRGHGVYVYGNGQHIVRGHWAANGQTLDIE